MAFLNAMTLTHSTLRSVCGLSLVALTLITPASAQAAPLPDVADAPILVIGASYAEGKLPLDDMMQGPFGGSSVGFGSYMDLGDALSRQGMFVVNEAQAGATAADRPMCLDAACLPVGWLGYESQLAKALARVAIPDPADPTQVLGYNAQYVYFGLVNDCMHSGAAGIPQLASESCTDDEIAMFLHEMVDVAQDAMDAGLVPVFPQYPAYTDIDLSIQAAATGLVWYANQDEWDLMAERWRDMIHDELPGAIMVEAWADMETMPDGLHPTPQSAENAALRIVEAIALYEAAL